jgi:serine/threonine protein kinase
MAAKYCPTCQKTFASAGRLCPDDRSVLSLNDPYHLVGRTLLDKYRIDALVGLGGMGAVYYAYHSGIDRRVAFKILQPNVALSDDHVVEMFEREGKLAGRLSHENIVDVNDAGRTDEGLAYIVMEWLEGRTLDEELLKQGWFGFSRAAGVTRQIAAALGEAHGKQVVHRDLKPGNIMLVDSPDGRDHVKVLDFGIGKTVGETMAGSMVSTVVGTPHYASPEQLTVGGRIDGRSDIYSLGVILYRMLGGKLPFNSSSMGKVIQMQLTSEPAPLFTLRPETPSAIERLVTGMLAKDPARRPQSAAEVIAVLDKALPLLEKADASRTGDTTIQRVGQRVGQRPRIPGDRTTEEMSADAPTRGTFSTNVFQPNRVKSPAVYATIIGAAVVAAGYGFYHYVFEEPASEMPNAAVAVLPPPSPIPTTVVTPTPAKNSGPGDRPEQSPSPSPRSRHEDRRQADKYVKEAKAAYKQRDYRAALRLCDAALTLDPQNKKAQALKKEIDDLINILNNPR